MREIRLDGDGQPPRWLYADRAARRDVIELLGFCKGLVSDGVVFPEEVTGLARWLRGHPDAVVHYPARAVAERVQRILADGIVDDQERAELQELLEQLVGETPEHDEPMNLSTTLPFDDPCPTILFDGRTYVFTGVMLHATRAECERMVMERGGRVASSVTKKVHYLVVGPVASKAWATGSFGTKIERALEYRAAGAPIAIVP
jgi:hypothetical protein